MSNETGRGPIAIRPAGALDAVNVVKLLRQEWAELSKEGAGAIDEQKALEWVTLCIREHFVLVADLQGRLVGSIAMKPLEYPWGAGIFLGQLWFFVLPTFRQGDIAERLVRGAELMLDGEQLFGMFRNDHSAAVPRIFDRRAGYRLSGAIYMRIPDEPRVEGKRA